MKELKSEKSLLALILGLLLLIGGAIWIALDDSHHYG